MKLAINMRWARFWNWLTAHGRIGLLQPMALLPGPLALVVGFVTPYRWIFFVGYCYVLLVLLAYSWVRVIGPAIVLRRRFDAEWAQVGDTLEETWELTNGSWLPLLWLEIRDDSTLPGYNTRRVAAAGSYSTERWQISARCERRGVYQLGPLGARFADPFGLFCYEWHDTHTRTLVIYPPLVRLAFTVAPQGQRGGLARADVLQQHVTPSVGGLREYVRGDPLSRIHWPTVARTNRLMIKEFDQDRAGALWVVLDLSQAGYQGAEHSTQHAEQADLYQNYTQSSVVEGPSTEIQFANATDLAIALACSVAAAALAEGRTVGFVADDGQRRLVAPGSGQHQLWRIVSSLVDAEATGNVSLGTLIEQNGYAGGAVVVVTPALDGMWLPSLASRTRNEGALALLVAENTASAQPLVTRLGGYGMGAHVFLRQNALPLLNPRRQTTTARVSPLGKLIRERA